MTEHNSRIRIKRVYAPPERGDGARVLVDRLWPRGLRKEDAALTLWLKDIAPSDELRRWFGHDPARWVEFARRYRAELAHKDDATAQMAGLAGKEPVTLLYAAHDGEHNNAVVLASWLQGHLRGGSGRRSSRPRLRAARRSDVHAGQSRRKKSTTKNTKNTRKKGTRSARH
jgi:uncharacterized protein YeaO (DUF488 family)